ncbi:MAG: GNAT family protein [Pseudomonadota bacterium]
MNESFWAGLPRELVLTGAHVKLEPLQTSHAEGLFAAAADGELWNLKYTTVPNRQEMAAYIDEALANQQDRRQHPFTIRRTSDEKIVGCTRFYDLEPHHRNLAIGYTWYAQSVQRTALNTEAKLLLLSHAFDNLDCISVAFHTDNLNERSQAAIMRLGAQKEGVLRNHKRMPDGRIRHTWCYSIIDSEWPAIKTRLTDRLAIG